MNADLERLGRRAVSCKGWRWRKGMSTLSGAVLLGDNGVCWRPGDGFGSFSEVDEAELPDLSDLATVGALLGLVREAWGIHDLYSPVVAEALVAALEAAP